MVSITDNEVIYETIWGEVDSFDLKQVKFLENKPLPFWIPQFGDGHIKFMSITWQEEEIYAISFFSKISILNTSVIDIVTEKCRAVDNPMIE